MTFAMPERRCPNGMEGLNGSSSQSSFPWPTPASQMPLPPWRACVFLFLLTEIPHWT